MLPDSVPSYALTPFVGLAINGTFFLGCLVLAFMYRQYKPLRSLTAFYAVLTSFFLGHAAYALQLSEAWILNWYRFMLLGLVWMPFAWLVYARDLSSESRGALYYICLCAGILGSGALLVSDHPAVLGPPLVYYPHGGVWRPRSWFLRPAIYVYDLTATLACVILGYRRWWRGRPKPSFVFPLIMGLVMWLAAGLQDALVSANLVSVTGFSLLWLGGLGFAICQAASMGLYFRDRLRAQEKIRCELRDTQTRFQEMAELSPSAIAECDTELRLTYANRSALEMLGHDQRDLEQGIEITALATESPAPDKARLLELLRAGGTGGYVELRLARKDGRQIHALVNFAPMFAGGELVGGRAAALDISERTQTAQALKASEERYRNILDQMEDGYYESDLKGNFTFFNDALCTMLERDPERMRGLNYRQFMDAEQADRAYQAFNGVYLSGRPQMAVDWKLEGIDGRIRFFQVSIALMRDAQGQATGFRGVARDVTQLILAEQERQDRLSAQLANQAKTQFLAKMSHEVRTPINAILGLSDLAADGGPARVQAGYLAAIQHEAQALMALVNDILDFTKIEAGKLKIEKVEFALRGLVEDLAAGFAPLARRGGVDLYCRVDHALPALAQGDPSRLNQMLANLVGNAIKFTARGEIAIEVEPAQDAVGPGLWVRFAVRDSGIGIAQEKLASIFESFTQADASTTRRYGGSGLGLTIVKELAELMGGESGVESQAGQGSCFWFQVPLSTASPYAPARPGEQGVALLWHQSFLGGQAAAQALLTLGYQVRPSQSLALGATPPQGCRVMVLGLAGPGQANAGTLPSNLPPELPLLLLSPSGQAQPEAPTGYPRPAALVGQPLRLAELARALDQALGREVSPPPGAPAASLGRPEPAAFNRPDLRVLVAEDYPTNRQLVRRYLEKIGCQVVATENGRQAVEAFERQEFGLVLLDVQMPEMDGYDACRAMRAIETQKGLTGTPMIAMTAHATTDHRQACFDAGMNDYLAKPFRRGDLLAMVQKWTQPVDAPPVQAPPSARADSPHWPMDLELALAECDQDSQFLRDMLAGFDEQAARRLDRMRQALADGDTRELANQAHAIKGSAGALTAHEVAETAVRIEASAHNGDLPAAKAQLLHMAQELDRLRAFARASLS